MLVVAAPSDSALVVWCLECGCVIVSDFLLTPTPKPVKSERQTPKFTPGSWSRDFSFWGGTSPRSSVSGLISSDFAVPKPQGESNNAGDTVLESFISSYANQPFCDLPEPSPTMATFSQMCF